MKHDFSIYVVYAIIDPRRPTEYRYIGVTNQPLKQRLSNHICIARHHPNYSAKNKWISHLMASGQKPCIVKLELCGFSNAENCELAWIEKLRPSGLLFNTKRNSPYNRQRKDHGYHGELGRRHIVFAREKIENLKIQLKNWPNYTMNLVAKTKDLSKLLKTDGIFTHWEIMNEILNHKTA